MQSLEVLVNILYVYLFQVFVVKNYFGRNFSVKLCFLIAYFCMLLDFAQNLCVYVCYEHVNLFLK